MALFNINFSDIYLYLKTSFYCMSQHQQIRVPKVFSIQVSGIRCTSCAGKIKKALTEQLPEPEAKIAVNIMQEKISLTIFKDHSIIDAIQILKDIGYPPIGEPVPISGGDQNHRNIAFLVTENEEYKRLVENLPIVLGVVKCGFGERQGKKRINVTYNCEIIKGKEIGQMISQVDKDYVVVNDRINSFSKKGKGAEGDVHVGLTIALCLYFFVVNMILPILPFDDSWYNTAIQFPTKLGIYTISVMVNFIITMFVMIRYARGFIVRAFKNYVQYKVTNMQTLIALGSLSAYSLFLFFLGRYTVEYINGEMQKDAIMKAIMDINDSLTSASIIVLVVTVGKYFEGKVKEKIEKMTQQIFPQSTLFSDMAINYVQIKNRQLKIDDEKKIDASLVEKNDIIRVVPGRLLLDVIVISGSVKAVQSARTGCQDLLQFSKGQRLQSGSDIREVVECLAIVENVLQKSLLIQIGTQIKLAQNQEESQQSSIQAVCKTISGYFVKGVILLSLITILTWSLLLSFIQIDVKMCDVCWIIERGIGVLVASCPCALGLAVPSVMAIILNLATKSGILIKNNSIFQKMKIAQMIAFDKTGTLFTRINKIEQHIAISNQYPQARMWEMIALIQKQIRHPLAQILYKEAFTRCEVVGTNYNFILLEKPSIQKEGISAKILDKQKSKELNILIGNKHILKNRNLQIPSFKKTSDASTELFLIAGEEVLMVVLLNTHSNLRPQAKDVISKIKKQGLQVHILSGDSQQSVQKLGQFLQIDMQCQHPEQSTFMKMKWIKEVQEGGKKAAIMIGDGLNDIPCLQEAGIGISINAKSELNINAADVVILSENLYKILALIRFIKKGNLFIKINLFWAFAYNIVIMPIVAGVFFPLGVFVSPVWSSIAMSFSSLLVVGFSHILSFFHYDDSFIVKQNIQQERERAEIIYEDQNQSEREIKQSLNKMRENDQIVRSQRLV